ncbi:MAG: Lcl C-terminal domain-containing protein, partial [Planctomycetota bacterium]
IVDTGQIRCYNNSTEIEYPKTGAAFFGQDAHYKGNQPAYKDNGDGTVSDLNTGLMWQQNPGRKKTYSQAVAGASKYKVGGYSDWRVPTIKELYSLILFSGTDPDPGSTNTSRQRPFIDAKYFKFQYGKAHDGDRVVDSQYATSTIYGSTTMNGNKTMFGINFADGRIKGYPIGSSRGRREKKYYVMYVRGNADYGRNNFKDNSDGTVTDNATGLMWMKIDSGKLKVGKMNWQQGLEWAENLEYAGYSDWRVPNVKELHSIIDYTRCPDITNSAAIDPIFEVTSITNEGGRKDYPYYWTSTSHCGVFGAEAAAYMAFGRSLGWMQDRRTFQRQLQDVHGAGAQRSDPKTGNASKFPYGRGPQGDVIRIYNYVRCVRGGKAEPCTAGPKVEMKQTSSRLRSNRQEPQSQDRRMGRVPSGDDFVRRLDRDGDGKVSREEFDGPVRHFRQLDKNRDGYLSNDEAPQGPPPGRNKDRTNRQTR